MSSNVHHSYTYFINITCPKVPKIVFYNFYLFRQNVNKQLRRIYNIAGGIIMQCIQPATFRPWVISGVIDTHEGHEWATISFRSSGPTGTPSPRNLGWIRWGHEHKKPAIFLKRCKIGPRLLWRTTLIGSRIRAFDWYHNQWPWMTLNTETCSGRTDAFYDARGTSSSTLRRYQRWWVSPFLR